MAEEFVPVTVRSATREGPRLTALILDLGESGYAACFTRPGQYVRARPLVAGRTAKEGFFALANAPGSDQFELLVQTGEPASPENAAEAIAGLTTGGRLEISRPTGKGFPLEEETGRDVWLFAGGSGISAIRSALEYVALHRQRYGRVVLLFGARKVDDLAYRHLFEGWRAKGVEVVPVLSRPEGSSWEGRVGFVQHALDDVEGPDPTRASAFLAGGKAFLAAVSAALEEGGMARERIFRNF